MKKGYISEIFLSIQGEGILIGLPQVFVRFCGCNIRCSFCDTEYAQKNSPLCQVFLPFSKKRIFLKNPIDLEQLQGALNIYKNYYYHSISFTGGEPLLQNEFLKEVLSKIKYKKIYLETNGVLYNELKDVISSVDIISMDIKLPSSQLDKKNLFLQHKKFLKIAKQKELFIKIVLTEKTSFCEFKDAIKIIKNISSSLPLVLQSSPSFAKIYFVKIFKFITIAASELKYVRFIPQMHKVLNIK